MKVYDVYYVVKMNSTQYVYCLAVEAKNAAEAKKKVVGIVYRETGRNAFTPTTKKPWILPESIINGIPPKKVNAVCGGGQDVR